MKIQIKQFVWILGALLVAAGCDLSGKAPADQADHQEHDGHDHQEGQPDEDHHDDADHPDEEENHDDEDHAGEERVHLSEQQRERIGLRTALAEPGTLIATASFPGELSLNPDRITHVVPTATGFVRSSDVTIGDPVEPGDVLAWIESADLAEAKMAYFSTLVRVGSVRIVLPRTQAIHKNVGRLLDTLETGADSAALAGFNGLEMGEWRGRLLTAHTQYQAARSIYQSERKLRDKNISSEREFVEAEAAYLLAEAELNAARDTARFRVQVDLLEAAQELQVAEFEAVAAHKKLTLMGVGEDVIADLRSLVIDTSSMLPCLCEEAECGHRKSVSVFDTLGQKQKLGWYALKTPTRGMVIAKHLTIGEHIGDDADVFRVVDTDSLWLQFDIYQKDLPDIREGQPARVVIGPGYEQRTGTIQTISPLIDEQTRTVKARMVLGNQDGRLRPGLFVTVHVETARTEAAVVIPRDAVQTLDEREVVFVVEGDGYVAEPVVLGRGDKRRVEVISGLSPGARYVTEGAFELKALIVTSGLDAHAGHGH